MTLFLLILQQIIGAGSQLFAKSVTSAISPYSALFLRGLIAGSIYFVYLFLARKHAPKIEPCDRKKILLLAAINVPVNQALFLTGVSMTTAPNSAIIYAFTPVIVLIMSRLIYGERITPMKSFGMALAVAGIALIMTDRGADASSGYLAGNLLVLAASVAWSAYAVFGKEQALKYGAFRVNALNMALGYAAYSVVFLFLPVTINVSSLSVGDWTGILYLGLMTSCASYLILYTVLKTVPAGKVAVFNNLTPALTTLFAVFIWGDSINEIFIIGASCVVLGVTAVQRSR